MVPDMSFTGTPVIQQISSHLIRITGIDLAPAGTTGTIGLFEATGTPPDIRLPASFRAPEVSFQGVAVPLQASIRVGVEPVSAAGLTNLPPSIAKTGTTPEDFRVTLTNTKVDLFTQTLEVYIESRAAVGHGRGSVVVAPVITIVDGEIIG